MSNTIIFDISPFMDRIIDCDQSLDQFDLAGLRKQRSKPRQIDLDYVLSKKIINFNKNQAELTTRLVFTPGDGFPEIPKGSRLVSDNYKFGEVQKIHTDKNTVEIICLLIVPINFKDWFNIDRKELQ